MITELINERLIRLNLSAQDKDGVLSELVDVLDQEGRLHDKQQFLADIYAREELGNTGFEDGVAIPHAKSRAVKAPAVVIGISRNGIEYGAEDGLPSQLFFMIASPDGGANHHIEVLAELSSKLIEEGFIAQFLAAQNEHQALELLLAQSETRTESRGENGFLIGVTGCPTGVAHTYLAAEALEKGAAELGYRIKVETNGSIGVKNSQAQQRLPKRPPLWSPVTNKWIWHDLPVND